MDPLSIAAGVTGLLAFTGTVISKGYSIASSISGLQNLTTLLQETTSLSGTLAGINARLSCPDPNSAVLAKDLEAKIDGCKQVLGEINMLLDKSTKLGRVRLALRKASFDEEAKGLLSRLEGYRSFFILCLQLQNRLGHPSFLNGKKHISHLVQFAA